MVGPVEVPVRLLGRNRQEGQVRNEALPYPPSITDLASQCLFLLLTSILFLLDKVMKFSFVIILSRFKYWTEKQKHEILQV